MEPAHDPRPGWSRPAVLQVPLAWLAATGTKVAVSRGRPADVLQQAIEATAEASGPGYPSGHTAVAVALATALWPDLGGAAIGALAGLGARALATRARRSGTS